MRPIERRPIHPIVRLNLALMLSQEYGMSDTKAVDFATKLIKQLRARNMDVVIGDWMAGERKGGFDWNDIAKVAAEWEERKPWSPVELR